MTVGPATARIDRLARSRLGLLLLLAIGAVLLVGVVPVVNSLAAARAISTVTAEVSDARAIGLVIEQLQRERLLAVAYVESPAVPSAPVTGQFESTVDEAARASAGLSGPAAAGLRTALAALSGLATRRPAILTRQAALSDLWTAYGDAVAGLTDGLRLGTWVGTDAGTARHLLALDALVRAGEQASQVEAALVVASVDVNTAAPLARPAALLDAAYQQRFRDLADPAEIAMLDQGRTSPAAQRSAVLQAALTDGNGPGNAARPTTDESLALAQTTSQRRGLLRESVVTGTTRQVSHQRLSLGYAALRASAAVAVGLLVIALFRPALNRSISRPRRRLAGPATTTADDADRELLRVAEKVPAPELAPVTARAEVLASMAQRTRSLVAQQRTGIDELERLESDPERLACLSRLDHLTARLHRSAERLLVVAGVHDADRLTGAQPLSEVIRAAMAGIEDYQRIRLGPIDRVLIPAPVAPNLTLLLAELMENATGSSSSKARVDVLAACAGDCVVHIVDYGSGLDAQRLAQENLRLAGPDRVADTPTDTHGFFVVGGLARWHGIRVRLLATPGGGLTVEVHLPVGLYLL